MHSCHHSCHQWFHICQHHNVHLLVTCQPSSCHWASAWSTFSIDFQSSFCRAWCFRMKYQPGVLYHFVESRDGIISMDIWNIAMLAVSSPNSYMIWFAIQSVTRSWWVHLLVHDSQMLPENNLTRVLWNAGQCEPLWVSSFLHSPFTGKLRCERHMRNHEDQDSSWKVRRTWCKFQTVQLNRPTQQWSFPSKIE